MSDGSCSAWEWRISWLSSVLQPAQNKLCPSFIAPPHWPHSTYPSLPMCLVSCSWQNSLTLRFPLSSLHLIYQKVHPQFKKPADTSSAQPISTLLPHNTSSAMHTNSHSLLSLLTHSS